MGEQVREVKSRDRDIGAGFMYLLGEDDDDGHGHVRDLRETRHLSRKL